MENLIKHCERCDQFKNISEFEGFKRCKDCRAHKRSKYSTEKRRIKRANCIYNELCQNAKLRSFNNNIEFNLTEEYVESIFPKDNICPIRNVVMHVGCLSDKSNSFSLDRIDSNGGYVIGNVQVISHKANLVKYTATLKELEMFKKLSPPQIHAIDDITRKIIIEDRLALIQQIKYKNDEGLEKRIFDYENTLCKKTRARAKENNIEHNLDPDYIKSIFPLDNCCPVFGFKFGYSNYNISASIDRINPKLGYLKGNVQILSRKANSIKSNCDMEELVKIIDSFRSYYDRTGTGIILER